MLATSATRNMTIDAGIDYEERGSLELRGVRGERVLYSVRV